VMRSDDCALRRELSGQGRTCGHWEGGCASGNVSVLRSVWGSVDVMGVWWHAD